MNLIKNLKCEYCTQPVGIDIENPVFSWTLASSEGEVYQQAYRIIVTNDNKTCWDTDYIDSNKSYNIAYSGSDLNNLTGYDWKVYIKSTAGETYESDSSRFVTGILKHTEVKGLWIEHPSQHDNPVFYGDFYVKENIKSAYIIISGLGYYEFSLNDERGHDTYNVPGWTDYTKRDLSGLLYPFTDNSAKRVLYNVYDVQKYLRTGINRYKIMLGNGFFNQTERLIEGDMSYGTTRLFFELHITFDDGAKTVIVSDEDTFCTDGPLEFNNVFFGEIKNDNIGLDFSGELTAFPIEWEAGVMSSQYDYFDRIVEVIEPVMLNNSIYDSGKGISGRVRISAEGPRGAQFTIQYADALTSEGELDFNPSGGEWQIQENKFIFGEDSAISYAETFGWRGFRYFSIEKDEDVLISKISVEVINCSFEAESYIKSDSEIINWIFSAYKNSQTSNMHGGVPSDCPHRERLGYTGDGQVTAESALHVLDSVNFYRKWNDDIIASQNIDTGFVPHTVPFCGGGGGPAWGSACAIVPEKLFEKIFDERLIHDSYSTLQNWIKYLETRNPELIIEQEEEGSWCLGEWCIPVEGYGVEEIDLKKIFAELSPELVNTAYFYKCVNVCIDFGKKLSRETTYYERMADRIKKRFNDRFLDKEKFSYATGRHTANVYALFFKLVPDEYRVKVTSALISQIEQTGYAMDAGIFAVSMIFNVLADAGRIDVIDKILKNSEFPSFGFMKNSGAANLWETWEGKASLNHPMFGGVVSFFYKYVGGIRYVSSVNRLLIEPVFLDSVDEFEVSENSIYGEIKVGWKRINKENIEVTVKLPGNTRGALKFNDTAAVLPNGITTWSVNTVDSDISSVGV